MPVAANVLLMILVGVNRTWLGKISILSASRKLMCKEGMLTDYMYPLDLKIDFLY